jgi:hypothetical protein
MSGRVSRRKDGRVGESGMRSEGVGLAGAYIRLGCGTRRDARGD